MCRPPTLFSALVKEAAVTGDCFDEAEEALRKFTKSIKPASATFDPDQWLPSELIEDIISLLDAPALRIAAVCSRDWKRRCSADAPWLALCITRWQLPPGTHVSCAAPARLLYALARPAPTMRKGLRGGTQLRVGASGNLVTLAFGGALGVGDRSCVADAPFFGDQACPTPPLQRAPLDGSFSRRIFGEALSGQPSPLAVARSLPSPLTLARSLMNGGKKIVKRTPPRCVAVPRCVQEETFPFSGTVLKAAPSLVAYFELRIAQTGAPREVTERNAAAPPCVAIGCCRAGFDASRLMPGWDAESWGYHGDDGGRFHGDGAATERGPPFGRGDVVGCGVDRSRGELFFTRNGKYLGGTRLSADHLREPLYPCVGLDHGDEIQVNFGAEPFAFDLDAFEARSAREVRSALQAHLPPLVAALK